MTDGIGNSMTEAHVRVIWAASGAVRSWPRSSHALMPNFRASARNGTVAKLYA